MTADRYAAGTFCWADVTSPDPAAAKDFYGRLFGWTFEDSDMEGGPSYTLFRRDGRDVSGLGPLTPEMAAAGVPPHWAAYVAVDDVARTVNQAADLGGAVVLAPVEIPDAGRMAIIRDPQGANLSLWQREGAHAGYLGGGPGAGAVCWNELMTPDPEGAADFYRELFEWRLKDSSGPYGAYFEFLNAAGSAAGMLPITPEMGDVPPNWLVYFAVEDCDAAAARAAELGGGIIRPGTDIPEIGRFAIVHDPAGAVFAVIAMEGEAG